MVPRNPRPISNFVAKPLATDAVKLSSLASSISVIINYEAFWLLFDLTSTVQVPCAVACLGLHPFSLPSNMPCIVCLFVSGGHLGCFFPCDFLTTVNICVQVLYLSTHPGSIYWLIYWGRGRSRPQFSCSSDVYEPERFPLHCMIWNITKAYEICGASVIILLI